MPVDGTPRLLWNGDPVLFTDGAIREFVRICEEKGASHVRIALNDQNQWNIGVAHEIAWGDAMIDCGDVTVLVDPRTIKAFTPGSEVDWAETGFMLKLVDSDDAAPDHTDPDGGCEHLKDLPQVPTPQQLTEMRKGLRKQKVPSIHDGWSGGHPKIGRFSITREREQFVVEWVMDGSEPKSCTFEALCSNLEHELDRLEFGWMIANMAQLDKIHNTLDVDLPHPLEQAREKERVWNYFEKIEKRWRHWAVVPAGHMIVSAIS